MLIRMLNNQGMLVPKVMEKMIRISEGNTHDVAHFMKVYTFAKTIGELEGLDEKTQELLEITTIIHDIACPLCRKKYGNTNGKNQELESPPLVEDFLREFDLPESTKQRISWLVSHHHTYTNVDGLDYQIMLEADYLVNADESHYTHDAIEAAGEQIFKTETGKRFLREIFLPA